MSENENDYQSYLLRIWRVGAADQRQWRITLEETLSGKVVGFPSLEALMEHLQGLDEIDQRNSSQN